jgi:putative oxidoreductase
MTTTIQGKVLTRTHHLPRLLLGLLFLLPGTLKLFAPFETVMSSYGTGEPFMRALHGTGYLFTLLALTQISAGLLLLVNRFVPLALTLLAPIISYSFIFLSYLPLEAS